jgi:hypothetical protein
MQSAAAGDGARRNGLVRTCPGARHSYESVTGERAAPEENGRGTTRLDVSSGHVPVPGSVTGV